MRRMRFSRRRTQTVAAPDCGVPLDALLLSRIQFGFVISFHVLFPAFTIGLSIGAEF